MSDELAEDVVDEITVPDGDLERAASGFFSARLDLSGPPGRFRILGLPDGRQALLLVVHHAVCDGVQLTRALVARATGVEGATTTAPAEGRAARAATAALGVRGLWSLATGGRAPRTVLRQKVTSPCRRQVLLDLPARELRRAARALGVRTTELLVALVAQALAERVPGVEGPGRVVRVIIPYQLPGTGAGNRTGASRVDLPVGPMTLAERAAQLAQAMRRPAEEGQALAARWVVEAVGVLPGSLHRWAARLVYRSTWFSAIVTVLPWGRGQVHVAGSSLAAVYPVLPLADGVQLSVGAIQRTDVVHVCLTLGPALAPFAEELRAGIHEAAREPARTTVPR